MHIHSVKQAHEVKWEFESQEATQQSIRTEVQGLPSEEGRA